MDTPLTNIPGIGEATAEILGEHGYKNCEDIAKATPEELAEVHGFGVVRAQRVIAMAQDLVATPEATEEALVTADDPPVEKPTEKQSKKKKKKKEKKEKKDKKNKKSKKKKGKKKKK